MGELLKYCGLGMVCSLEQLYCMRKPFLGNGERALLLIFLREVVYFRRCLVSFAVFFTAGPKIADQRYYTMTSVPCRSDCRAPERTKLCISSTLV